MAMATVEKPHAVCVPFPTQGHISPMLNLAKLLHRRGFHVTFVLSHFNHARLLKSRGSSSLGGVSDFQFESIPDGLPPPDNPDATQDVLALCVSTANNCLVPFRNLLAKLNGGAPEIPPVTCVVYDGMMSFALEAAQQVGVPGVAFWTVSACSFICLLHFPRLLEKGFTPFKDVSSPTEGNPDTIIDWIPGIPKIRLRDIPSSTRTTDPDDACLEFIKVEISRAYKASANILNTFDALELDVLDSLSPMLNRLYTVGPLHLLLNQFQHEDTNLNFIGSNLWEEDPECFRWLDSMKPGSVLYVNFGSITVLSPKQLVEFAWGLANSMQTFLWIIRPDLVMGESAFLPPEFLTEIKDRGMIASWCAQEQVLMHPSVGGFLTHSGWNSTLESVCGGVPMICWPFFSDQHTNSYYSCEHWGFGTEIDHDVKREEVTRVVRELMEEDKGKEMKKKVMDWMGKAEEATRPHGGSSFSNLNKLIREVLLPKKKKKKHDLHLI